MLPVVLLIALMASPWLGILLAAAFAHPRCRTARLALPTRLPIIAGAGAALIAAWMLLGQADWETVVGNWSPVSFTGLPLVVAGFAPSAGIVIAWTTLYFLHSVRPLPATYSESLPVAPALLVAALTIVAFANNLVTLLVGLGLTDLLTAYWALRRQDNERDALIGLMLNGLSIALMTLVTAVHIAAGNSLHLPLVRLDASTAPTLALAIALRLNFVPFRASSNVWGNPQTAAGALGGLLTLTRLPALGVTRLPEWFSMLALVSALLTLIIALLQAEDRADALAPAVATSSAYLACTSAVLATPGATAAATIAWLVGATLIGQPRFADAPLWAERVRRAVRAAGALCLIGSLPTVGFVGQAGIVATWAERGADGWPLAFVRSVVFAVMTYVLLKLVVRPADEPARPARLIAHPLRPTVWAAREAIGGLAALAPILIFGIAPALLMAGSLTDALARNSVFGWASWGIAIVAGALLWRLEPRWRPALRSISGRLVGALELGWFYSLLDGAVARLRHPFGQVFTLLEGDGMLLWAIIAVLLTVLIARPGGP
ncbi:MAG: hypothetical protein D6709_12980 [Chloroflexi bacterium]|uniref:Uncharacterized protein n=1 Tax=Candidatus Thermofonsia Clade 3 bacterium TaxID=2364212 RepID=A0A2M8QEA9_9CHLR|nr:hypothetical protein [Candidatus Roseilinea sp. NK_OTU-006]PJF48143.1 MAG: hypothetical protein CUN48_05095 [Candidatus Thermofonsia Clade 3 bacterium]RMG62006.1 MAG: hypothetical protein D6709_12980 [Chloroflexota bacterium]